MATTGFWLFFLSCLYTSHSVLNCDNDSNICSDCTKNDIQCPDPQIYGKVLNRFEIHATENEDIEIVCFSSPIFNETLLPNITLNTMEWFRFKSCSLPTSNFRQIADRIGLNSFQVFTFEHSDLSSITLTKDYFVGFENLEKLDLNNNNLVNLEEDVFENTPNLIELDLRENQLKLKKNLFRYTLSLESLDLYGNNLTEIPSGCFKFLSHLSILYLQSNSLVNLNDQTFDGLVRLKILELSGNQIEAISNDTFRKLPALEQINLSNNKIKLLSMNLFANNQKLNLVMLRENKAKIKLSEKLFGNLPFLTKVDLTNTKIERIPENLFQNSTKLTHMLLSGTNLNILPYKVVVGLCNLESIDLSHNEIVNISFPLLKNLKKLYLAKNKIEEIEKKSLAELSNLEEIDISHNRIKKIADLTFENNRELRYIDLSHNFYQGGNNFRLLQNVVNAKKIDLSYNLISNIGGVIDLNNKMKLNVLSLSNNRIKNLKMVDLVSISKNLKIQLESNNISEISTTGLELIDTSSKAEVFLNNNPINCNCKLFNFIENSLMHKMFKLNMDKLTCVNPPKLRNKMIKEVKASILVCPLEEILDGKTGCPNNCSCAWKPYDKSILVNCTRQYLKGYPELNFNLPLQYPFNQTELHLEENNLVDGPSINLTGYKNITRLYLSNNRIRNILWIPEQIKELTLDYNNLTHLDNQFLKILEASNFSLLSLNNNSWDCNCKAFNFIDFLRNHIKKIDTRNIFCSNSQTLLINLSNIDLCRGQIIYVVLLLIIVLLLVTTAFAVYYRHRDAIDAWLLIHGICGPCLRKKEDQKKIYDVFISYSHKDEEFVTQTLLPVLESKPNPFKTCVHFRDFIPGEFIVEQVTNSVLNSRRTLVVLSPNFLQSVWGKMEFRTAHTQAMTDRESRVILILYGDINIKNLDSELEMYIKSNTYIKWGDPYFWTKLLYALPHKNKYANIKKKQANKSKEKLFINNNLIDSTKNKSLFKRENSKSPSGDFVANIEIDATSAENTSLISSVTT